MKKTGLTRAGVIKLCLGSFLDHFERHGKAVLPLNWEDVLRDMDGRTHRYAEQNEVSLKAAEAADDKYLTTADEAEFARIKSKPRPEWTKREESFVLSYLKKT